MNPTTRKNSVYLPCVAWWRRGLVAVCAFVVAVVLALAPCVPASAGEAGLWYIDDLGVRDAWAQGITGKGVKVAVLDSDVVSDYPALTDADVSYKLVLKEDGATRCHAQDHEDIVLTTDEPFRKSSDILSTHGTEVVGMIVGSGKGYDGNPGVTGIAPDASVTAYPIDVSKSNLSDSDATCMTDSGRGIAINRVLSAAIDDGARVVNMSFTSMQDPDVDTYVKALRKGVIIVNARWNTNTPGTDDLVGEPMDMTYFPGTVTVSAVGPEGKLSEGPSDTKDGNVSFVAPGTRMLIPNSSNPKVLSADGEGNSYAAPMVAGYVALAMQKWPDATGNQILQALVRSTKNNPWGAGKLDPEHRYGYGQPDVAKLLSTDPSQYPDINPLLEAAVTNSDAHEETQGMYTDRTDPIWKKTLWADTQPFPDKINVQRDAVKVGVEYERQKTAWAKVEQCRKDGGADCMQYSATATADEADEFVPKEVKPGSFTEYDYLGLSGDADGAGKDGAASASSAQEATWLGLPVWAWVSIIVAVVLLLLIAVLAIAHHNQSIKQQKRAE
ncbi:peptidase, S8/S53 family [Bifidobacterium castoris]|uniref:Peptidase, S8/S53 family n=2 Tax=Bifidobacterium castoris TaxID=2306972 RepID=A0A430F623_9BIFI|nr:peptidase, S8/S53 family [Bifidobacterium castoris]